MTQDRELVRVLPSRVDRGSVGFRQGAWRMQQRGVHPGGGHLRQRIFHGVGTHLPVIGGHCFILPDMDLGIDGQHGGSSVVRGISRMSVKLPR